MFSRLKFEKVFFFFYPSRTFRSSGQQKVTLLSLSSLPLALLVTWPPTMTGHIRTTEEEKHQCLEYLTTRCGNISLHTSVPAFSGLLLVQLKSHKATLLIFGHQHDDYKYYFFYLSSSSLFLRWLWTTFWSGKLLMSPQMSDSALC